MLYLPARLCRWLCLFLRLCLCLLRFPFPFLPCACARASRQQDILFGCMCYRQIPNEKDENVWNILLSHGVQFTLKVSLACHCACLRL